MSRLFPPELHWLFKHIRPHLVWHAMSFLCITAGSVLALLNPLVMKWLIDQVLPKRDLTLLFLAVAAILVTYEGRAILNSLGSYLTLYATQKMAMDLRLRLLKHFDLLSADYHDNTTVGAKLYPLKEPIDEIAYFGSDLFPSILRTVLATTLTLVAMTMLSLPLTLVVFPLIPVFVLTRHHFRKRLQQDADTVQQDRSKLTSFLQEHLASTVQVQLLQQEKRQERLAFRLLAQNFRSYNRLSKTSVFFSAYTNLAIVLAMASIIGFGGWSVLGGTLTVGGLVAFYSYITQLFEPLSGAVEQYSRAQRTFASIRQVQGPLAVVPTIKDAPNAVPFSSALAAAISLRCVRFGYKRQKGTIQVSDLVIRPGERVALIGENGAGKSTLAKLMARIYDVDEGAIQIGGCDIRKIKLATLRAQVCYLPQHPVFFDGTLLTNLKFGNRAAPAEDLEEVLNLAELAPVLRRLPRGWEEWLGPGGSHLSDGERQRLAIARALLQRPRILILDEATSSLDATAEKLILRKLDRHLPQTTLVVISHRLSSVSWIERMLVLRAGRVVQDGNHLALEASSTLYADLLQASSLHLHRRTSEAK